MTILFIIFSTVIKHEMLVPRLQKCIELEGDYVENFFRFYINVVTLRSR